MNTFQKRPSRQQNRSTQIRIRLQQEESEAFEQRYLLDKQAGKAYAKTFSTWVRHQLKAIIYLPEDMELCVLDKKLYDVAAARAQALDMKPEDFIEACILGVIAMASQAQSDIPEIVRTCRNQTLLKH